MIKVWVLIAYLYSGNVGGPLVIDNLASQQDCLRLSENIEYMARTNNYRLYSNVPARCVEVWKVK